MQDKEGWYVADECGWDLTPRRRFRSQRDAELEICRWLADDDNDRGYQHGYDGKVQEASASHAYRAGYAEGQLDKHEWETFK